MAALLDAARELLVRLPTKAPPEFGMTLREMKIAAKIATKRANREVGREFSIRERTVKHHLTNKVGVSSRPELAIFARDRITPQTLLADKVQLQPGEDQTPQLYLVNHPGHVVTMMR